MTDTEFAVRASPHSRYTFVYEATDAAGNTATASTTVLVQRPGR